jgi:outer membrane protein TolC
MFVVVSRQLDGIFLLAAALLLVGCAAPQSWQANDPIASVCVIHASYAGGVSETTNEAADDPIAPAASHTASSDQPVSDGQEFERESQPIADPTATVPSKSNSAAPIPINLPTALAMIGGQHPVVGYARWKVQEAYAEWDRARVMWLPSLQLGMNYRRHDGNYQAVDGQIVDVNLNSLNYGLGVGAIAAGGQTQPGIVARFHLADALFAPAVAEKTVWALNHSASASLNQQLLQAAIGYIDLLEACQELAILEASLARTASLATITRDYAEAGEGLRSDADRTATELALLKSRQLLAQERMKVASSRLARALAMPMTTELIPQDSILVPLCLNQQGLDEATHIATGLASRPELKESQALVAAACQAHRREKYAPFVPSVLLGMSAGTFGGGLGSQSNDFGGRYDAEAMMIWEVRNMGLGEQAARQGRHARVHQATYANLRIMDQVAQEVAEAHVQTVLRKQQIEVAREAIVQAERSYDRNMARIQDAEGLPIEVLQSIQALEQSQRCYLNAVASYNRAQLQLGWATGWPIDGSTTTISVSASSPDPF